MHEWDVSSSSPNQRIVRGEERRVRGGERREEEEEMFLLLPLCHACFSLSPREGGVQWCV